MQCDERVGLLRWEVVQRRAALGHHLLPEHHVPHERPSSLSPISAPRRTRASCRRRAAIAAVSSRSRVEPRVQRASLQRERRHGHRVLEQAAEVGVVARARAGRPARARARKRARRPGTSRAARCRSGRRPRARGARGSRPARPCRGRRVGRNRAGSACSPSARADRLQLDLQLVAEALAPARCTRTSSPRSNCPARKSASRNARAGIAPVRSRSSSAGTALPLRAVRRSLRVHANTPSTSPPDRAASRCVCALSTLRMVAEPSAAIGVRWVGCSR